MECPSCRVKAIKFTTWLNGLSAFKTDCSNCGVALKANVWVYFWFIVTVTVTLILFPYVEGIVGYVGLSDINSKLKGLIVLAPVIFIGGVFTWFFGGYKVSK